MVRQGVNHCGDVYSGIERLGDTLEIISDFVRVSYVSWHEGNYWTTRMRRKDKMGNDHL